MNKVERKQTLRTEEKLTAHFESPHSNGGDTFLDHLRDELIKRCQRNPSYSLRAFAKSLQVEPSALSQIINNKRPLSAKMRLRIGTALGLSVNQIEQISKSAPQSDSPISKKYQQITLDSFALISEWYHFAILELTYTEGFKSDNKWISQRLGITKTEANLAVERLMRMGLLIVENGRLCDTSENGRLSSIELGLSSDGAKKYQRQILELSIKSLQEVDIKMRSQTSAAICFDPKDMQKATKKIAEFRRQFAEEMQPDKKAKEVYQLQISFFPLTRINKE